MAPFAAAGDFLCCHCARYLLGRLPTRLHPHEVVKYVFWHLNDGYEFDTGQFLYPSLPKYIMLGLANLMLKFQATDADIYLGARLLSVLLGAGNCRIGISSDPHGWGQYLHRLAGGCLGNHQQPDGGGFPASPTTTSTWHFSPPCWSIRC